jgi:hypothetical protein
VKFDQFVRASCFFFAEMSFGFMKRRIVYALSAALVFYIAGLVWVFGIIFEFEYPYTFILMRVRNATTFSGAPIAAIIKALGSEWGREIAWHTDSYCANWCGPHKNLICVFLDDPDKSARYLFAYNRQTHTLVPMTVQTAARFPEILPTGDNLVSIAKLHGREDTAYLGNNALELPAKWFQSVVQDERRPRSSHPPH